MPTSPPAQPEEFAAELCRLLVEHIRDYAALDAEGLVIQWNAGAEQLLGYQAEEILGRSVELFYPADEIGSTPIARAISAVVRGGGGTESRRLVRKDASLL